MTDRVSDIPTEEWLTEREESALYFTDSLAERELTLIRAVRVLRAENERLTDACWTNAEALAERDALAAEVERLKGELAETQSVNEQLCALAGGPGWLENVRATVAANAELLAVITRVREAARSIVGERHQFDPMIGAGQHCVCGFHIRDHEIADRIWAALLDSPSTEEQTP